MRPLWYMKTLKYRPLWYTAMWLLSRKCVILSASSPGIRVVLNILSYCHEQSGTNPCINMGSSSCLSSNLYQV